MGIGLVVGLAGQHHLAAPGSHGLDLDLGRGGGHDDDRPAADLGGGKGHALGVVAGGGADDAALQLGRGEVGNLVVGAAQLEGEHRLHVLALEIEAVAEPVGEIGRQFQGSLNGGLIDPGVEDFGQVVVQHGEGRMPKA